MDKTVLDLYTDYLISSFGQATATGLSTLLDGQLSHDRISRFLAAEEFNSATLWQLVKPLVRQVQQEDAVLIVDDSIEAKPYTDESELICWHYDHTTQQTVKGINLLSALYHSQGVSIPVAFELVTKPDWITDKKTGKPKRTARQTKNELYQTMLLACQHNALPFAYVLNDIWYASADNMVFVKEQLGKHFLMPIKSNRKVALSAEEKLLGRYVTVSSLVLEADATRLVWLEGVPFALRLLKQVFTNEDGSQGIVYLVTSDTDLTAEQMTTIYQKRWKVEEYHKSLKSNLCFAKSPTKTVTTQRNHLFASLMAFVKMERLRLSTKLNHFAMKAKLYQAALKTAYEQLGTLKVKCSPA
jgi:hypothetical protein